MSRSDTRPFHPCFTPIRRIAAAGLVALSLTAGPVLAQDQSAGAASPAAGTEAPATTGPATSPATEGLGATDPAATSPTLGQPTGAPTTGAPTTDAPAATPGATTPATPGAAPNAVDTVPADGPTDAAADTPAGPRDSLVTVPTDSMSNVTTPATTSPAVPTASPATPSAIPAEALPHDLSPIGMYRQADIVVKAVMLGLAFASVLTWTVLVLKLIEFFAAMSSVGRGAARIEEADSLHAALPHAEGRSPDARMLRAAARELNRSGPHLAAAGVQDRISSELSQIQARAVRQMNRGTGILATIGSTAPFVGLFGTVWGIMNSFIGISEAQTTNLAVVAPGIAEALLATAIGLVAAIPAVVIYNVFARASGGYRLRLNEAAAGVQRLVSRDLDRRAAGIGAA